MLTKFAIPPGSDRPHPIRDGPPLRAIEDTRMTVGRDPLTAPAARDTLSRTRRVRRGDVLCRRHLHDALRQGRCYLPGRWRALVAGLRSPTDSRTFIFRWVFGHVVTLRHRHTALSAVSGGLRTGR
ncbi:hypothetical protein Franean1_1017 [Parafrankia sp. EAN1pec]|nr:hypothetical protein Franean1_1017 [Frankia sp. EAN1pec]